MTTLFFLVSLCFFCAQTTSDSADKSDSFDKNIVNTENIIEDFYAKILELIPNARNLKDLGTVATVRYQMRDEINDAIIFSAQFLKKNKNLIPIVLTSVSECSFQNDEKESLYNNDVANLLILKSIEILASSKDISVNFQSYKIFDRIGTFSKKINFLFNINELTYPEHIMISYDATGDIKYLKMLINYLDITEEDEKTLTDEVSKINFEDISEQEKGTFKKFVFLKHVRSIIKAKKNLFEEKRKELLKQANNVIRKNFDSVLQEN